MGRWFYFRTQEEKWTVWKDYPHYLSMRVFCVEYRGRFPHGMDDELLDSVEEMANEVVDALEEMLSGQRVAFYGHSFGGLIAWQTAMQLQKKKSAVEVTHLCVGGEEAPFDRASVQRKCAPYRKMPLAEFARHLQERSMLRKDIVDNIIRDKASQESFQKLLRPTQLEFALDSEFDMKNLKHSVEKLTIPVVAFIETEDEIDTDAVEKWELATEGPYKSVYIQGPHLFCHNEHNATELCEALLEVFNE